MVRVFSSATFEKIYKNSCGWPPTLEHCNNRRTILVTNINFSQPRQNSNIILYKEGNVNMVSGPKSYVSQESSQCKKQKSKLSYSPLQQELPLFEKLFKSCDIHNTNTKVIREEVHSLLALSCLPDDVVKMIMSMTNNGSKHLDRKQFYIAIRLVQLRQNRVSVKNLTLTVPENVQLNPPFFRGFKSSSSVAHSQSQVDDNTNGDTNTGRNSPSHCDKCAKYKKEIEKLRKDLRASQENVQKLKEENARLKGREKNIDSFLSAMDTNENKPTHRNSISPHPFSENDEMEESNNGTIRVDDFGLEDMHRLPNWTKRDSEIYTPPVNRPNTNPREINNGGLSSTIHGYPRRIRDFDMLEDKFIEFEAHSLDSKEEMDFYPPRMDNHYDEHTSVIENVPKHLVFPRRRSSVVSDITSSMTIRHKPRMFEGIEEENLESGNDKKRGKKKRSIFGQRTKSIKSLLTDWT